MTGRMEHGDLIIIMSSNCGAELDAEDSVITTPSEKTVYSKAELEEMAESVGFWWHSIDLGQGVVTKGFKTPETLQYELESLRLPDLRDKTVLDIGAWDGFFSFEAERRGAKRVVALDHYVWSLDLAKAQPRILARRQGVRSRAARDAKLAARQAAGQTRIRHRP